MSFERLQWIFPIAVTLHNAEEAIWMPGWTARHASQLPVHPPSAGGIRLALLALTVLAFAVTALSAKKGAQSVWAYLAFGYIVAMWANVLVPHLPASVMFLSYTPGVVTAVFINLPVMSYLAVRAMAEHWVIGWKAALAAVAMPAALGSAIAFLVFA
jgi:hypothetical protein